MADWRLELNGYMIEDLSGTIFYKITFPEFWEVAYREKNVFYQMIERYAKSYVESTNKGHEFLEGEKIQHFWHEHCDLCYEKAMTDINCTFYVTDDMRHWICEECFNDFMEKVREELNRWLDHGGRVNTEFMWEGKKRRAF